MPLPNLEKIVPQFDITIPSTGQTHRFRPFLVKEEKLLLIAMEGEDEKQMLDAMVQVVSSCSLSPIKVDDLANFDLEFIFLNLRARSVDSTVELNYRCHNVIELTPEEVEQRFKSRPKRPGAVMPEGPQVESCDNVVKIKINLDDVKVKFDENHRKQIFLTDTIGVNMRYPNYKMAKQLIKMSKTKNNGGTREESVTDALNAIALCIESLFDEESVYTNFSEKEIQEWIERLTQTQFIKLQQFFESIPKLAHDVQFVCSKCGYQEPLHIEGLPSFFG